MNLFIQQSIQIHSLRITNITNSSVLQIGSAGIIKSKNILANSGNFRGEIPEPLHHGFVLPSVDAAMKNISS